VIETIKKLWRELTFDYRKAYKQELAWDSFYKRQRDKACDDYRAERERRVKLEKENQRLRELVEQLKADLKTALQAYRDVVSKM